MSGLKITSFLIELLERKPSSKTVQILPLRGNLATQTNVINLNLAL
jgi:hypothetical protein